MTAWADVAVSFLSVLALLWALGMLCWVFILSSSLGERRPPVTRLLPGDIKPMRSARTRGRALGFKLLKFPEEDGGGPGRPTKGAQE